MIHGLRPRLPWALTKMKDMSDVNAMNLEPGEIVGGYELVSRLGSGAMGSVWRVRDGGGQLYAMKILRDSLSENTDTDTDPNRQRDRLTARERLRREAMSLQRVRHPNVCGITDMELDDSLAFIVTELIEGKNLRDDVATNGRYTGDDLERLAGKLIEAVKAVHAAGIIHRDIKPTNVMISTRGPVLVDFGIAMGEGESHVTRTGLVMGTPGFIAPEIIEGSESDEQTDWWSVASVLGFAATGSAVFGTKPMMAVLEREASGNANLAGLPPMTLQALRSALDPNPQRRCDPDELLRAISTEALDPLAWDEAQSGVLDGSGGGSDNGSSGDSTQPNVSRTPGMIHPFEAAAASGNTQVLPRRGANPNNPRTLWRDDDSGTQLLAVPASATYGAAAGTNTIAMPRTSRFEIPRTEPITDSATRPALQKLINRSESGYEPASLISNSDTINGSGPLSHTRVMPTQTPLTQVIAQAINAPTYPPVTPTVEGAIEGAVEPAPAEVQSMPEAQEAPLAELQPKPADIKRGAYYSRGSMVLWLLTIPLALVAPALPLVAISAVCIVLWLLFTMGFSTESQLERESKRGGTRKRSDGALRVASLPWHAVKALVHALLGTVIVVALAALVVVFASIALHLPTGTAYPQLFGSRIAVPLLSDTPISLSGLALSSGLSIGWLVASFGPRSMMIRLGAGALRGLGSHQTGPTEAQSRPTSTVPLQSVDQAAPRSQPQPKPRPEGNSTRQTIGWIVWFAIVAASAAVLLTSTGIDFFPLYLI